LATTSLVAGEVIMKNGKSVATGGAWIVTAAGEDAAKASGLKYEVVDLEASQLYVGWR